MLRDDAEMQAGFTARRKSGSNYFSVRSAQLHLHSTLGCLRTSVASWSIGVTRLSIRLLREREREVIQSIDDPTFVFAWTSDSSFLLSLNYTVSINIIIVVIFLLILSLRYLTLLLLALS